MKEFINQWKPKNIKKLDKDSRGELLYTLLPSMTKNYILKGKTKKHREKAAIVRELVLDKKFISTVNYILKRVGDDFDYLDTNLAIILVDAVRESFVNNDDVEEEVLEKAYKLIGKLTKKNIKSLLDAGCDQEDLAEELAAIAPNTSEKYMTEEFVCDSIFGKVNSTIIRYIKAHPDYLNICSGEFVLKIFKALFKGNYLSNFIQYTLLIDVKVIADFNDKEREVWNAITEACIIYLEEECEKDELKQILKTYIKSNSFRYNIASLPPEDYKRISKFLNKLKEK